MLCSYQNPSSTQRYKVQFFLILFFFTNKMDEKIYTTFWQLFQVSQLPPWRRGLSGNYNQVPQGENSLGRRKLSGSRNQVSHNNFFEKKGTKWELQPSSPRNNQFEYSKSSSFPWTTCLGLSFSPLLPYEIVLWGN